MKNVVITGVSAGIGEATARLFAQHGNRTILIARREEKLKKLQKELGNQAIYFALDISSFHDVNQTFASIEEAVGPIDILVNNAGVAFGLDPFYEMDIQSIKTCIDVNINGLLYCTHAALKKMVERNHGHIINLGSVAGSYPYPGGNVYCGTKAFIHQFSLCLRADLLGTQIRVSCIEPGLTGGTEFSTVRFSGDEIRSRNLYEKTHPLQPEDIAQMIYFCAATKSHVNVNSIELMPVTQSFAPLQVHKKENP